MKKQRPVCIVCGKPLENPASIERGMGEICAAKYANFRHVRSEKAKDGFHAKTPQYSYRIELINGERVGVVIDEGDGVHCPSVTNAVETVAKAIGVCKLVYRDSRGSWDFWGEHEGFRSLAVDGKPTKSMDAAMEIARARFFGSGLFA